MTAPWTEAAVDLILTPADAPVALALMAELDAEVAGSPGRSSAASRIGRALPGFVFCVATGPRQVEALALYRSAGYRGIASYGEYVDNPESISMEKALAAVGA